MVKPNTMKKLPLLLLLLAGGSLLSCQKWTQNLQGVGILTVTPSRETAEGWSSDFDGIAQGAFPAEETSSLFVGLFEIDGYTPTDPTVPATGAYVELSTPTQSINLCETIPEISGEFVHPPSDDALALENEITEANGDSELAQVKCSRSAWNYQYQEEHTLSIDWNDKVYELFFTTPNENLAPDYQWSPAFEDDTSTLDSDVLSHHPLNTELTLTWTLAETTEDHLPLISISRLIYSEVDSEDFTAPENWSSDSNNPIYQSPPQDTQSLLYFLVAADDTEKTIEKLNFSQVGLYLITVHDLILSTNSSSNLSLGSGILSGSGKNYLIWVH